MDLGVWRDISLIWLLFLTFISVLPIGIILFLLISGMRRLRQVLKMYLPLGQEMASQFAARVSEVCDKIIAPFVAIYAGWARLNAIAKAILGRD